MSEPNLIKTGPVPLVACEPEWDLRADGRIVGIFFWCPCGKRDKCPFGRIHIYFENPIGGGAPQSPAGYETWRREGETFERLSLFPSLHAVDHWHGHLRSGVFSDA